MRALLMLYCINNARIEFLSVILSSNQSTFSYFLDVYMLFHLNLTRHGITVVELSLNEWNLQ